MLCRSLIVSGVVVIIYVEKRGDEATTAIREFVELMCNVFYDACQESTKYSVYRVRGLKSRLTLLRDRSEESQAAASAVDSPRVESCRYSPRCSPASHRTYIHIQKYIHLGSPKQSCIVRENVLN